MENKYPNNDYEKSMADRGLTPEQAHDLAVDMLRKVNFSERALEGVLRPLENLGYTDWEFIQEVTRRPEDLARWAEKTDLSDFAKACNFITYLTTD